MNWDSARLDSYIDRMAEQAKQRLANSERPSHLIGIHTGGVWVAEALNQRLAEPLPLSTLAPDYYRDDFEQRGIKPKEGKSQLPTDLDDCNILLVDDVLMSGRTIRAAINELFDYGRPAHIWLAVLFDIGQRELPIQADICGEALSMRPPERVELRGPSPLTAALIDSGDTT